MYDKDKFDWQQTLQQFVAIRYTCVDFFTPGSVTRNTKNWLSLSNPALKGIPNATP
jgi:hypothetical protein